MDQRRVFTVENSFCVVGLASLRMTPAAAAIPIAAIVPSQNDFQADFIFKYSCQVDRLSLFSRLTGLFNPAGLFKFGDPKPVMLAGPVQIDVPGPHRINGTFHSERADIDMADDN